MPYQSIEISISRCDPCLGAPCRLNKRKNVLRHPNRKMHTYDNPKVGAILYGDAPDAASSLTFRRAVSQKMLFWRPMLNPYMFAVPQMYRLPTLSRCSASHKMLPWRPDVRSRYMCGVPDVKPGNPILSRCLASQRSGPGGPTFDLATCTASQFCRDARRPRRCCPNDPTFYLAIRGVPPCALAVWVYCFSMLTVERAIGSLEEKLVLGSSFFVLRSSFFVLRSSFFVLGKLSTAKLSTAKGWPIKHALLFALEHPFENGLPKTVFRA